MDMKIPQGGANNRSDKDSELQTPIFLLLSHFFDDDDDGLGKNERTILIMLQP
jgi:hypothetical protein